jgi:sulfofructose kinase
VNGTRGDAAASPAAAFVGLSCRDHVWRVARFPPTASRTEAHAYRGEGGGPAATAACAAARLGVRARLWAVHGDDEEGRANEAELRRRGVDLGGCATPPGSRSFVSAVIVGPDGERHIFPFRGRALRDDPSAHDWTGLEGVGVVLVDARHPALADRALAWAERRDVVSVGDWGDLRHPELRARVDHLIASEEAGREAERAASGGADEPTPTDPIAAAVAAIAVLRARPGQLVALTLGPLGCVWDDGRDIWLQAAPRVEVVDSNGAGDAFHGAYAAALAGGATVAAAMRLATAVGALKCTGEGRDALPDRERARAVADTLPPAAHLGRSTVRPGGTP